ncbi:hypothetical protein Tco_0336008 [Tanacetum coccineum]
MGLWYPKDSGFELIAYSDADHAGCKDDCKSTSGGLQFLGGKLMSWSSKKQDCTTMSTAEAEYVSLSACCAQVIWMRTQLLDYGYKYNRIPMYCDSKKHVEKGTVEIYFVGTEYQLADLFTKALPKERFEYLVHRIVIIMAQQQHAADVHPDELCPPNKRYDLMDANKKVDLEHFWHTLKEDGSKYKLKFMLDKKELTLTLDDFSTIFHLPQATDNNHNSFVPPPLFSDMVPFYKQVLGFTMELKTSSSFKTTGLLQQWQTLCKIFSKCLTTLTIGRELYYSLHHPTSSIPYPRFTKIIVSHYMTIFPDISRRTRDKYHNLQDDDIMKNIFNSERHKDKVGMQIPAWMITEEMKHTEHYQMYAEAFRIDVPLTQSQPTESTQGTHRTPSAPRSPNPNKEAAELSALRRSTVIRLRIPKRRSICLTPPAPVPNVDKEDDMILQDTLQVSLTEHKSHEEQEARENVALVDEHLASEEIEKMVDGQENVVDDSSIPRNDESNIPGTRIEPRSNKESPEVEITKDKEVEITKDKEVEITKETLVVDITNVVIPVNVNDEDEEITDEVYELKRREKGKIVEETRNSPIPTPIRSPRIHTNLELQGLYGYLFAHLRARFMPRKSFDTLADNLHDVMVETLPTMVDKHIKEQVMKQVPEQVRNQVPVYVAEGLILERQKAKEETERLIAKAILQELDASVRSYMSGHILHVHPAQSQTSFVPDQQYQLYLAMKADPQLQQQDIAIWLALQMKFERNTVPQTACRTPAVRPRDQDDPHDDAHPEGKNSAKRQKTSEYEAYVSGGDMMIQISTKQVSQDIIEEVSLTIDEAKLRKMADEMLRQRCTSGDKHQSASFLSLINQDLLYLKKGNSGPEKIVLSLHKFPAVIFNDDDLKNELPDGKQKEPGKPKVEVYSNSKIIQVVKTYWELGHEHKFITKIVARRANKYLVSITEPDYKNLNKNDIEDIYLLIMNGKKVNLTAPTMTFLGIEDHEMFSIIYELVHGIIYKNSKKEKRVMRHLEIHKFCDATLNRVLEEEIEKRLKHRRQMRRWEMFVNGRPLGPRRERHE